MLKIITQVMDTTTAANSARDVKTFEDKVNAYIQTPTINPNKLEFQVFEKSGGSVYLFCLIDFTQKRT